MVPGAAVVGSVVPASERKPSMTRWPSATMATTGPESMNSTSGCVERLALVLGVVLGQQLGRGRRSSQGGEPVALGLDAPDHLAGQAAGARRRA